MSDIERAQALADRWWNGTHRGIFHGGGTLAQMIAVLLAEERERAAQMAESVGPVESDAFKRGVEVATGRRIAARIRCAAHPAPSIR